MSMDDDLSDFFKFETPMPTQNQTETSAFTNSQIDFKLPMADLDEQVEDIRRRAEIILEKLLALPTPEKSQNSPPKPINKKIIQHDIDDEEENVPKATIISDQNSTPNPPHPVKKKVKAKAKAKGAKSKQTKTPQYIIPKKEPIVIPGANERYEQQLVLLQQQLQRLNSENNRLQALIREYKMKLREWQIEQEKLKYMLKQSQQQSLNVNAVPLPKPKAH